MTQITVQDNNKQYKITFEIANGQIISISVLDENGVEVPMNNLPMDILDELFKHFENIKNSIENQEIAEQKVEVKNSQKKFSKK